jgi:hypothetical protein
MSGFHTFMVSLLLALVAVKCRGDATFVEEDGVLMLNEKNFDEALRQFSELFVNFCKFN